MLEMLFSYLEKYMEIFFPKIRYIFAANSHQFVAKSIHLDKAFQAFYAAGHLGLCSSFYITRATLAMLGRKKEPMTACKRKKAPTWIWKNHFLFRVFAVFALQMVSRKTKEKAIKHYTTRAG